MIHTLRWLTISGRKNFVNGKGRLKNGIPVFSWAEDNSYPLYAFPSARLAALPVEKPIIDVSGWAERATIFF
jgi:hypothetical protein